MQGGPSPPKLYSNYCLDNCRFVVLSALCLSVLFLTFSSVASGLYNPWKSLMTPSWPGLVLHLRRLWPLGGFWHHWPVPTAWCFIFLGSGLSWFSSNFSDHSLSHLVGLPFPISVGIPQVSVLGSLLFSFIFRCSIHKHQIPSLPSIYFSSQPFYHLLRTVHSF